MRFKHKFEILKIWLFLASAGRFSKILIEVIICILGVFGVDNYNAGKTIPIKVKLKILKKER